MYYTIGQRKGLNIGGAKEKIFVVGKDLNKNELLVANGENNEYLFSDEAVIDNINWLSDKKPNKCTVKFRYRQTDIPVEVIYKEDTIIVKYPNKSKAVTPGQACVFYLDDECLGGGIIKEVRKNNEKIWYL